MTMRSRICARAALAALCILALPVAANAFGGTTKAHVPFDFVIGGKIMPAGDYSFVIAAGRPTVAIRSEDGTSALVFLSRRTGNHRNEGSPQLVFERRNNTYVLKEVVTAAERAPAPMR